jgi:hypothetical protein
MAYVYRHIRLDKNQPFYIGIGSDNKFKRANATYKGDRNNIWYKIAAKSKYEVEILFNDLSWEQACEKEKEFIKLYGRKDLGTGVLANMTDGGEGVVGATHKRTKESIKKQSDTMKKRMQEDPEFKAMHINNLRKGSKKRKYGLESEETKKKKSDSHKILYGLGITNFIVGANKKKVFCIKTGKVWESAAKCALENEMKRQYLTKLLNGTIKTNKSNFRYYGNE